MAVAGGEGATLFMALQTALAVFMARYSGADDVVMSTAIAGRRHGDLDPVIGMFVNDLVLRMMIAGPSGSDLGRIAQNNRESFRRFQGTIARAPVLLGAAPAGTVKRSDLALSLGKLRA